jgi:copper oxidase (laccase) domain-containing protein
VLESAVAHLRDLGGTTGADLEGAIGPAIGRCCYEVGPEVREAFTARTGSTTAAAWVPRAGRWHVDLRAAACLLLGAVGVAGATLLGPCTACGRGYCSYRRDGAGAGRQFSFVGWV